MSLKIFPGHATGTQTLLQKPMRVVQAISKYVSSFACISFETVKRQLCYQKRRAYHEKVFASKVVLKFQQQHNPLTSSVSWFILRGLKIYLEGSAHKIQPVATVLQELDEI